MRENSRRGIRVSERNKGWKVVEVRGNDGREVAEVSRNKGRGIRRN